MDKKPIQRKPREEVPEMLEATDQGFFARIPRDERRVFFYDDRGNRLRGKVLSARRRWIFVGGWVYRVLCSDGKRRTVPVGACGGNKFSLGDYA